MRKIRVDAEKNEQLLNEKGDWCRHGCIEGRKCVPKGKQDGISTQPLELQSHALTE